VQHGSGIENQPAARMVARAPRAHFRKGQAHHVDAGRHRQQLFYFFFIEIEHVKNASTEARSVSSLNVFKFPIDGLKILG
jgi:hypothetical protein